MGKILITRPEPEASSYAAELRAQGFDPLVSPMLRIEGLDFKSPDLSGVQGLVFSSVNAVRMYCAKVKTGREIPVFCVGDRTAAEAKDQGFIHIYNAKGTADDLVQCVCTHTDNAGGALLYIRGYRVAKPVGMLLEKQGFEVRSLEVYDAKIVEGLSNNVQSLMSEGGVEAVILFSGRTSEAFLKAVEKDGLFDACSSIKVLCISTAVLEYVRDYKWSGAYVCDKPDRDSMLMLLRRVCVLHGSESESKEEDKVMSEANKKMDDSIDNAAEVIELFGGIRPMAKKIGAAVTTVQGWKKRDTIPAGRRTQILEAAAEHGIDLSSVLDGETLVIEQEEDSPANENLSSDDVGSSSVDDEPLVLDNEAPAPEKKEEPIPTALRASPRALDRRLAETEKKAVRKSTWINLLLVLLGLLAVAVLVFGSMQEGDQRFGAIEQDVESLRGDVDEVKDQQSFLSTLIPANLDERIAKIQDQAEQARESVGQAIEQAGKVMQTAKVVGEDVLSEGAGTIAERTEALKKQMEAWNVSPQLQNLLTTFQSMSQSSMGQIQMDQAVSELSQALSVADFSQAGVSVDSVLHEATASSPSLSSTFQGVPADDLKAAALLLGMTQFRNSLNRDGEAFADDLQVLKNLIASDEASIAENKELLAALDRLAPEAETGVLTPSGLAGELQSIAGDAVMASLKGEDVALSDQVNARIGELFKVEKNGEQINGTDTQIKLSEAHKLLEEGDVVAAIYVVEGLEPEVRDTMQPWLDKAYATMDAQELKTMLENGLSSAQSEGEIVFTEDGVEPISEKTLQQDTETQAQE